MLTKNRTVLQNFAEAIQHEWLETNGLGGWASSSVIGTNTRRYHGLLVAADLSLSKRMVLLSKMDETIVTVQPGDPDDNDTNETRYELGVNLYANHSIQPNGNDYLDGFSKELFPQWEYEVNGIKLKKTIVMVHGENTVLIIYDVLEAPQPFTLELLPLMAGRDHHSLTHEGPGMHWHVDFENGVFHNQPDGRTDLFISVPGSVYRHSPQWYHNFQYIVEQYRGLDYTEDLFNHGVFSVELKQGDSLGIIVSTENPEGKNAHELLTKENMRRQLLISHQPDDETFELLTLAADQFIVKKSGFFKTIVAGYHWLTDWGRDTLISLPGLCLSTGRFEDAKKILTAFAKSVSMGMLPNHFNDADQEQEFDGADTTLWYFIAVNKYLEVTGDKTFVLTEILPVLKNIIDWHYNGTRHSIRVTDDGLLVSGEPGQQLTWMDAKMGQAIVSRSGKPVELQALWYNALRIFAELLQLNGQEDDAGMLNMSADRVRKSFGQQFWYVEGNYLYDNIDRKGEKIAEFRPNQLFAISLPFPLIEGDKAKVVVQQVTDHLYTPAGLKTLPNADPDYLPVATEGEIRDLSYHDGMAWSWLLGPYVDAIMRTNGRDRALEVINNFKYHLNETCIGSIAEVFEAEPPYHPRGCIAHACAVAELLRVIKDYQLYDIKMVKAGVKVEAVSASL
jgi:predicted glycogen debranching enzyme